MVYFVKATANGLIVADQLLSKKSVTIKGVTKEVPTQGGRLGFVAWKEAKTLDLKAGEKLPFTLSEKQVTKKLEDGTREPITNLYWCNPE